MGSYFSFQRRVFLVWAFFSSLNSGSRIWNSRCRLLSPPLKPAHQEGRTIQRQRTSNKKNTRTRKTRKCARGRQKRAHERRKKRKSPETKKNKNEKNEKKQRKISPKTTGPDPTGHDRTGPDRTRPDPTRPDPSRSDPTWSEQARPDPTRPDATRPDPTPYPLIKISYFANVPTKVLMARWAPKQFKNGLIIFIIGLIKHRLVPTSVELFARMNLLFCILVSK